MSPQMITNSDYMEVCDSSDITQFYTGCHQIKSILYVQNLVPVMWLWQDIQSNSVILLIFILNESTPNVIEVLYSYTDNEVKNT